MNAELSCIEVETTECDMVGCFNVTCISVYIGKEMDLQRANQINLNIEANSRWVFGCVHCESGCVLKRLGHLHPSSSVIL